MNDPNEKNFLNQEHHAPLLVNTETDEDRVIVLFRVNSHQKDFPQVPRVDCQGRVREKNVDECSFTGPVSILLFFVLVFVFFLADSYVSH